MTVEYATVSAIIATLSPRDAALLDRLLNDLANEGATELGGNGRAYALGYLQSQLRTRARQGDTT